MKPAAPRAPASAEPPHAGAAGGIEALLGAYSPPASGFDEMLDAGGAVRPHYRPLLDALARMEPGEREARALSARQYLSEAGVFHRVYDGSGGEDEAREWPLAQPPLLLDRSEWARLEDGLVQRATFLEKLLADLYGARSLIQDGTLPAAILAQNPEFLHPVANQASSGAPLLHFVAFDLGRGPDGRWRVLGDRAQAPSGAGFALENRVATARAFPDLTEAMRIRRLAGFFTAFRDRLFALGGSERRHIGLLTPGPRNETYFEHAYLARYLGMLLLEGGDLVVHGDKVEIRTVDGFQPVRVLWRRLDADFADPLELRSNSRIGTPGLCRAVRAGTLSVVNALGSGLIETPALLAFGPALAGRLLGEALILPTLETWWCGDEDARRLVAERRDDLALAAAFPGAPGVSGDEASAPMGPREGVRLVGQAVSRLSTAPVFEDGRLVPRPVALRVFLARGQAGWQVMPGGFARIGGGPDSGSVSMQAGGRSVDVWVPGGGNEPAVTLIAPSSDGFARRLPGALPARAADNLFWLGRYAERCEAATRLLRLHSARRAGATREGELDLRLAHRLLGLGIDVSRPDPAAGLASLARAAADTASRIRDRFSPDAWRILTEIVAIIEAARPGASPEALATLASRCLTRLSGFTGLVTENMYQLGGWRFLSLGRKLERGQVTARLCADLVSAPDQNGAMPDGALEALLEFADSRITYRRRYSVSLSRDTVLDLVILDPLNPRSVAFQVNALDDLLAELPGVQAGEALDPSARRTARLKVRLRTADAAEATGPFLDRVARDLADLSDLLTARYLLAAPGGEGPRLEAE